jgi:Fe-S cluster assembly scaffold protein SufB
MENLEGHFQGGSRKTIPKKEKKKRSTWMSQDTLRVVEHRRQMKMEGNWAEVRKLNGEIQKRIRKYKENYLKEKCKVLEEHNKRGRTRDLYQQI